MQTYDMKQSMAGKTPEDHESASMAEEAPEPKTSGGMKIDRVEIRPTENGGFVVNCAKSEKNPSGSSGGPMAMNSPGYESKDYAFSSLPEAMAFVQQEFGGGGEAGVSETEGMEAEA